MPYTLSRAFSLLSVPSASAIQSARQLRQKPARPIRSTFCTSVRCCKCLIRRRKAVAATASFSDLLDNSVLLIVQLENSIFLTVVPDRRSPSCAGVNVSKKMGPRARKVKILATLGPSSNSPEMNRKLYLAGADAFRINMSHGDHADHAARIATIRALEKERSELQSLMRISYAVF